MHVATPTKYDCWHAVFTSPSLYFRLCLLFHSYKEIYYQIRYTGVVETKCNVYSLF